jgi:predicted flap endonuclease-1-like 5' DNA nuclease
VAEREARIGGLDEERGRLDSAVTDLEARLRDSDEALAAAAADRTALTERLEGLEAAAQAGDAPAGLRDRLEGLQADLAERDARLEALTAEREELAVRRAGLEQEAAERPADSSGERAAAGDLERRLAEMERDLAERDRAAEDARAEGERWRARVVELEAALASRPAAPRPAEDEPERARSARRDERRPDTPGEDIAEVAEEPGRRSRFRGKVDDDERKAVMEALSERFAAGRGDRPDTLTKIPGIGPLTDRLLRSMNIRTYRQIASFTADDIANVAIALRTTPDHIERDDWIGNARQFHLEEHGEQI